VKTLFSDFGVHAVVDGQFGSTGKGVLAAWLAQQAFQQGVSFGAVVSNAGPNSGHTFYSDSGEKHVLKQLPTFAVASVVNGYGNPVVYLSAGAIIDMDILFAEARRYPQLEIFVDPLAAVITPEDKAAEHSGTVAAVAGTRSGTGAALARKVLRDPKAVIQNWSMVGAPSNIFYGGVPLSYISGVRTFLEVSQGFSLGLNSEFYPKVTSRECTVMQGISDARIPPWMVERVYASMRTYPIRVGNVDGFDSGGCYPDQWETTWEALKQVPELTTVTQRVRRVFTFSEMQARQAIDANGADFVFMNFMNYLDTVGQMGIIEKVRRINSSSLKPFGLILGHGAASEDVKQWL
jgi:adenylosuccinate synthase